MDYFKLTNSERISILRFHALINRNNLPNNEAELLQTIKVEPGQLSRQN